MVPVILSLQYHTIPHWKPYNWPPSGYARPTAASRFVDPATLSTLPSVTCVLRN